MNLFDLAECAVCCGPFVARHTYEDAIAELRLSADDIEAGALLLDALESPSSAALRHTAEVFLLIRDDQEVAARTLHRTAEADEIDLHVAALLLEAELWWVTAA